MFFFFCCVCDELLFFSRFFAFEFDYDASRCRYLDLFYLAFIKLLGCVGARFSIHFGKIGSFLLEILFSIFFHLFLGLLLFVCCYADAVAQDSGSVQFCFSGWIFSTDLSQIDSSAAHFCYPSPSSESFYFSYCTFQLHHLFLF